ncbi:MAG: GNAT family N-acetyltransferase [Planctomycetota bacterium]|jgi:ribosomal-protein-alanine N-acetyltransferase
MDYRTKRLRIRAEHPDDEEACIALWSDPEVTRHVGGPRDPNVVREAFRKGHPKAWTVVELESERRVGEIFLLEKEVEGRREEELNYYFFPDVWGKGYATEAAQAVIAGRDRLVALIDPANVASRRVAEKLGFVLARRIPRGEKQLDLFVREPA